MASLPEPGELEMSAAKVPHDIFLSNLIGNHILIFTAISTFGQQYFKFMVLVPILSFLALGYTFFRASRLRREDSEFVYIHWQIARRWSRFFAGMLLFMLVIAGLGWLAHTELGMMKEAMFALVGGVAILPTLVTVLVLIVIESDSLHHARVGTLPKWAQRRYLGLDDGQLS